MSTVEQVVQVEAAPKIEGQLPTLAGCLNLDDIEVSDAGGSCGVELIWSAWCSVRRRSC